MVCQVIFFKKDRSWDKKERKGKDQKEGTGNKQGEVAARF